MIVIAGLPVLVVHRAPGSETTLQGTVSAVDGAVVEVEAFVGRGIRTFPGLREDDGVAEWSWRPLGLLVEPVIDVPT